MELSSAAAIYFIIWWLVLFMVLPWGVRRVDPDDLLPGEDHGAPEKPRMLIKLLVTTVLSGIIFAGVYYSIVSGALSFRP